MGALRLVPIGCSDVPGAARALEAPAIDAPAADSHKYRRGLLGVVGGAMPGAPLLAAEAALRSGAGYVKLLAQVRPAVAPVELVVDDADLAGALEDRRWSALLVGPGLGRDAVARGRLDAALARALPTVIDADALMLLDRPSPGAVLTPHEGEMAALERTFGLSGAGLRRERALALAQAVRAVVVLKGPDTVIASPAGEVFVAPRASSWLSVAGSGDVLAGVIASRLAVHGDAMLAAKEGVWLHGEAARLAGPAFTAGELARQVGKALLIARA
jgi:hydroxyethylthiazole kinase-like uncharacterized protein yjeF